MTLNIGDNLSQLTLNLDDGHQVKIADYNGKKLVLFLYPKDDTPGCTKESIAFSAQQDQFAAQNCVVIGLSKDSIASHVKFREKHDLTIPLASDEDCSVIKQLDAWVEKKNYGKSYMGVDRSTFLCDENGNLLHAWRKVRVDGHVDKVLTHIQSLS